MPSSPSEQEMRRVWDQLSIHDQGINEIIDTICSLAVDRTQPSLVITANIQHFAEMRKDQSLKDALLTSAVLVPDGWPVVSALRRLRGYKGGRSTGADLMPGVVAEAALRGLSIGIIGGSDGVAQRAAEVARERHTGIEIVIAESPQFDGDPHAEDIARLTDLVNESSPNLVFLCVGTPKSELLAYRASTGLRCGAIMCFGAGIDYFAGTKQRAPAAFRQLNLEWAYRIVKEPKRLLGRYLRSAPAFVTEFQSEARRVNRAR